jgi:23S rRNA G2445 N2-methylase RlmL
MAAPPGFSTEVLKEVQSIIATLETARKFEIKVTQVGSDIVVTNASFDNLVEITCRARLLSDVRMRLLKKRCHSWASFETEINSFPWKQWFSPESTIAFRASASASEIENASRMRDISKTALTRAGFLFADENPTLKFDVNILKNTLTIDISLAGAPLSHRGWRAGTATLAPLREDLAASVIASTQNFVQNKCSVPVDFVFVPFAGSGTIGIELLLSSTDITPLLIPRVFGFRAFSAYRETMEKWLTKRLSMHVKSVMPRVYFVENHNKQFSELSANCAKVKEIIKNTGKGSAEIDCISGDFFAAETLPAFSPASTSSKVMRPQHIFMPLNPPWGVRMTNKTTSAAAFYARLGARVESLSQEWEKQKIFVSGCALCPDEETWSAFKKCLKTLHSRTVHFTQGGRDIRLCMFHTQKTESHGSYTDK